MARYHREEREKDGSRQRFLVLIFSPLLRTLRDKPQQHPAQPSPAQPCCTRPGCRDRDRNLSVLMNFIKWLHADVQMFNAGPNPS